jgi:segregation and condensation protein B
VPIDVHGHPLIRIPAGWPDRVLRPPARSLRFDAPHARPAADRTLARPAAAARVEAVLIVADGPLTPRRIAQHAMLPDAADAKRAIDWLNAAYDRDGTAFRVERVAAGYRLLTRAELAPWLDRLHRRSDRLKLSPPALETLTIVAYRQPCTRADVEAVRGVQSAEMLKYLMERGLVRIAGEHDSLGRPYLYETTKQFLELFGLRTLADLPRAAELRAGKPDAPADA